MLQTRYCLVRMVPFDVPEWPKCSQRRGRLGRGGEALFQRHWFHVKLRYCVPSTWRPSEVEIHTSEGDSPRPYPEWERRAPKDARDESTLKEHHA